MNEVTIKERIFKLRKESNKILAEQVHSTIDKGSSPETYSFIITCLEFAYDKKFSETELKEIICDGSTKNSDGTYGEDCGIDAVVINKNSIDVYDFKEGKSVSEKDLKEFFSSVNDYVLNRPSNFNIFNKKLSKLLKKKHRTTHTDKPIRLIVVRGSGAQESPFFKSKKTDFESLGQVSSVELYDSCRLIDVSLKNDNYVQEWGVDLNDPNKKYISEADELVMKVRLQDIIELQKKCEKESANLFNRNVRGFIGNKNVFAGIIETLKKEPENFYKYHNGLTIAVEKIYKNTELKFKLFSPQIINGAQTINSIIVGLNTKQIDSKKVNKAYILCKVYVADNNLTEKISETSNTQAKVELSDLRSNDREQILIEKLVATALGGDFEYRRKKPFPRGKGKISLPEFTQWAYSAFFKKPAESKNNKQLLFDATDDGLYTKIYQCKLMNSGNILKLCNIGSEVHEHIRGEAKEIKSMLKNADMHIVAALFNYPNSNYSEVKRILQNFVKEQRKIDEDMTFNKMFTKSEKAWDYLEKNIK